MSVNSLPGRRSWWVRFALLAVAGLALGPSPAWAQRVGRGVGVGGIGTRTLLPSNQVITQPRFTTASTGLSVGSIGLGPSGFNYRGMRGGFNRGLYGGFGFGLGFGYPGIGYGFSYPPAFYNGDPGLYGTATFPPPNPYADPAPNYVEPVLPPAEPAPAPRNDTVLITVQVPADAEVWIEGVKMKQAGTVRQFRSPPLQFGTIYQYEVRTAWKEATGTVEQTRHLAVRAGDQPSVTFLAGPKDGAAKPRP